MPRKSVSEAVCPPCVPSEGPGTSQQSGIGGCVDLEDLVEAPCANFSVTQLLLCSLYIG